MQWQKAIGLGVCCGLPLAAILTFMLVLSVRGRLRRFDFRPLNAWRARSGRGLGIPELSRRLGVSLSVLNSFTPKYRELKIPKRSGGVRILHIPDPETKALQRRILHLLLRKLKAHPAAHGFERGRSIVTNAVPHTAKRVLIKLDIRDFFPSTSDNRIDWYFRIIGWDKDAAAALTRICTYKGGLPQGAPTSPRLSNLVNYRMDRIFEKWSKRWRTSYTRYADDLTFSATWERTYHTGRFARGIVQVVGRLLRSSGYQLNRRKVLILRSHQQQRVTGLVVNALTQLPRKKRRWLRAVEHRLKTKGESSLSAEQLKGWRALENMIKSQREKLDANATNQKRTQ